MPAKVPARPRTSAPAAPLDELLAGVRDDRLRDWLVKLLGPDAASTPGGSPPVTHKRKRKRG